MNNLKKWSTLITLLIIGCLAAHPVLAAPPPAELNASLAIYDALTQQQITQVEPGQQVNLTVHFSSPGSLGLPVQFLAGKKVFARLGLRNGLQFMAQEAFRVTRENMYTLSSFSTSYTVPETSGEGDFLLLGDVLIQNIPCTGNRAQLNGSVVALDNDGDGFAQSEDCNDDEFSINPDAEEICGDGIDQDCDGVDEQCPVSIDQSAANGIWQGTIYDHQYGNESVDLLFHEGTMIGLSTEDEMIYKGTYSFVDGNSFSGEASSYIMNQGYYQTIYYEGTVNSNSMSGSYTTSLGHSGSFYMAMNTNLYNRDSSLSLVSGSWTDGDTSVTISSNGSFTGNEGICSFSGNISTIDSNYNLYQVDITLSPLCAPFNGTYDGYASIMDTYTGYDTLEFVIYSGDNIMFLPLLDTDYSYNMPFFLLTED